MTLWVDRPRPDPGPVTHAILIGTSRYDHLPERGQAPAHGRETFGLVQARSPAAGAFRFARWLRDEYTNREAPLASIELLVAPSAEEAAADAELASVATATTRQAVQAAIYSWRDRCRGNRDGIAVLYVSGHGIQVSREDAIVLLQDFAAEPQVLQGAVDVGSVFHGMRGGDLPSRQFFFVDACRIRPEAFNRYASLGSGAGLDEPLVGDETRTAPVYFSASTDTAALGVPGAGTIFAQALIEVLGGPAATGYPDERGRWHVDVTSLQNALEVRVKELALRHNELQAVVTGGYVRGAPFHYFEAPPELTVRLRLDPDAAATVAHACVRLPDDGRVVVAPVPFLPNPLEATLPAGFYTLEVTIQPPTPPYQPRQRVLPVIPASARHPISVSVE